MIIRYLSLVLRKVKAKKNHKGVQFSFFSRFCSKTNISDYVALYSNTILSNVQVGKFTYFAGASVGNAVVGAFCSIGPGVKIGGMGHHPTSMVSTHPSFYSTLGQVKKTFSEKNFFDELPKTKVGNDVWIGANAIVLDGLNIGNGAIVAAGAVVIRDVPDYAVVAGVPAKVIKYRFNNEKIRLLNQASWWDWSEYELQTIAPLMRKADDDFFNYLKSKARV